MLRIGEVIPVFAAPPKRERMTLDWVRQRIRDIGTELVGDAGFMPRARREALMDEIGQLSVDLAAAEAHLKAAI